MHFYPHSFKTLWNPKKTSPTGVSSAAHLPMNFSLKGCIHFIDFQRAKTQGAKRMCSQWFICWLQPIMSAFICIKNIQKKRHIFLMYTCIYIYRYIDIYIYIPPVIIHVWLGFPLPKTLHKGSTVALIISSEEGGGASGTVMARRPPWKKTSGFSAWSFQGFLCGTSMGYSYCMLLSRLKPQFNGKPHQWETGSLLAVSPSGSWLLLYLLVTIVVIVNSS